jgi:hypothetical protein
MHPSDALAVARSPVPPVEAPRHWTTQRLMLLYRAGAIYPPPRGCPRREAEGGRRKRAKEVPAEVAQSTWSGATHSRGSTAQGRLGPPPTHGELRGGGLAATARPLLPQSRGAAPPQLGRAARYSPKGVVRAASARAPVSTGAEVERRTWVSGQGLAAWTSAPLRAEPRMAAAGDAPVATGLPRPVSEGASESPNGSAEEVTGPVAGVRGWRPSSGESGRG